MFNWRKNLWPRGGQCSVVALLVLAGCASNDDAGVLGDSAPVSQAEVGISASLETDPDAVAAGGDAAAVEVSSSDAPVSTLVVSGGDAESEAESAPGSAASTSPSGSTSVPSASSSAATTTVKPVAGATTAALSTAVPSGEAPTSEASKSEAPTTVTRATEAPTTKPSTKPTPKPTTPSTRPVDTTAAPVNRPGAFLNVNFQGTPTGTYDDARIKADWGGGAVRYTKTGGRAVITDEGGNRFVRIRFPKATFGTNDGGSQWAVNLGSNSSDELYISYRVRFVGDFNFVLGGKLPGLSGGAGNAGGSKPNGNDGWSSRIMWRQQGGAVQYVYHPDQPSTYGEDFKWNQTFPTNRWITVESRVKMNTPGQRDGIVQTWMDGRQVLDRRDVRFRDTSAFGIDRIMIDTFFGGNSSEWSTSKEEHIDFDDFVVSGSPITH